MSLIISPAPPDGYVAPIVANKVEAFGGTTGPLPFPPPLGGIGLGSCGICLPPTTSGASCGSCIGAGGGGGTGTVCLRLARGGKSVTVSDLRLAVGCVAIEGPAVDDPACNIRIAGFDHLEGVCP